MWRKRFHGVVPFAHCRCADGGARSSIEDIMSKIVLRCIRDSFARVQGYLILPGPNGGDGGDVYS